jgi:glycosyltransferase involved in cell wall biosynthesis
VPFISVIIPTYNRASLLPRALGSVLAQTFADFEVVVVDDGSTDETRQVVESLADARVRYIYQENSGRPIACNTGVAQSGARYVTFLDSDDEALPTWLHRFASVIEGTASVVVCCGLIFLSERYGVTKIELPRRYGSHLDHQRGLFRAGTFAVRRDVFDAAGGFARGAVRLNNTELALRLVPLCTSKGWRIESVDEPLVKVHRGERLPDYASGMLQGVSYILKRHRDRLALNPTRLSTYLAIAGVNAIRVGKYAEARSCLIEAIRIRPTNLRNYARLAVSLFPPMARLPGVMSVRRTL